MLYLALTLVAFSTFLNVYLVHSDWRIKDSVALINLGVFLFILLHLFLSFGWSPVLWAVGLAFVENFVLFKLFELNLIGSIKKSFALRALQEKIAPHPPPTTEGAIEDFRQFFSNRLSPEVSEKCLSEYLDKICLGDEKIAPILKHYAVSKDGLKRMYQELTMRPSLGWANGHYIPLSTLSYVEPLMYYIQARQRQESDIAIEAALIGYWKDNKRLAWDPIHPSNA